MMFRTMSAGVVPIARFNSAHQKPCGSCPCCLTPLNPNNRVVANPSQPHTAGLSRDPFQNAKVLGKMNPPLHECDSGTQKLNKSDRQFMRANVPIPVIPHNEPGHR